MWAAAGELPIAHPAGIQSSPRRLAHHILPSCPLPPARVAVNEEIDPDVLIRKLKAENTLLRQEVALLRGGLAGGDGDGAGGRGDADGGRAGSNDGDADVEQTGGVGLEVQAALSEGEQHALRRRVAAYLDDPSPDAVLMVEPSMFFIHAAFSLLKSLVKGGGGGALQQAGSASVPAAETELRSLRLLVQQQEQQIAVLAGVLRKQGSTAPTGGTTVTAGGAQSSRRSSGSNSPASTAVTPALPASSSRPSSSWGTSTQAGFQQGQPSQQLALASSAGNSARAAGPAKAPKPAYFDDVLADQHKAVRGSGGLLPACVPACRLAGSSASLHAYHQSALVPLVLSRSSSSSARAAQHTTQWRSTRQCFGGSTRRHVPWALPCRPPKSG